MYIIQLRLLHGECHVATADNVLDLKLGELGVEPELPDNAQVLAQCHTTRLPI
jgi:hypothetical protein